MCLNVYANGFGDGKGRHVSVFTCLTKGENDDNLKWPFRGTITVTLLDQLQSNNHCFVKIDYAEEITGDYTSRVMKGRGCLLYTSPSPRDRQKSRMPSSA